MYIIRKYFLEKKYFNFKGFDISLYQSDSFDKYFDSIGIEEIKKIDDIPYFINVWMSGIYLSEFVVDFFAENKLKGKKILELGSGCGSTGIVLQKLGADVIFSDYLDESLELCVENAKLNGFKKIETLKADWKDFPYIDEKIDYIFGSDLLYEENLIEPLISTLEKFLKKKIPVIISDPQRYNLNKFLSSINNLGYEVELLSQSNNQIPIKIFLINNP